MKLIILIEMFSFGGLWFAFIYVPFTSQRYIWLMLPHPNGKQAARSVFWQCTLLPVYVLYLCYKPLPLFVCITEADNKNEESFFSLSPPAYRIWDPRWLLSRLPCSRRTGITFWSQGAFSHPWFAASPCQDCTSLQAPAAADQCPTTFWKRRNRNSAGIHHLGVEGHDELRDRYGVSKHFTARVCDWVFLSAWSMEGTILPHNVMPFVTLVHAVAAKHSG